MLIRYAMLAIACFASGVAISGGYFAFISMIGIFPKLLEKVKGGKALSVHRVSAGIWCGTGKSDICIQNIGSGDMGGIYHHMSVRRDICGMPGGGTYGGAECHTDRSQKIQCEKEFPLCHIRPCCGKTGRLGAECSSGHVIKSKLFCVKWRYLL